MSEHKYPKGKVIKLDGKKLVGAEKFHSTFSSTFGFPDFYGRNMSAWVDCMSYLDDPDGEMTKVHVPRGQTVTLQIDNYGYFKKAGQKQWLDLLECSAFVNYRQLEAGRRPLLVLSFFE